MVPLPPMPTITVSQPPSKARRMSCPVPKVVVAVGSRRPGGIRARPDASASSTTAVLPSGAIPNRASTGAPSGPSTVARSILPPIARISASRVPSPPSATGH